MEYPCSVQSCELKAEIECICKLKAKYFCPDHFLQHRNENKNLRHIAQDIEFDREENNEICMMCNLKPPSMCCLCNNEITLLCQECVGIHSRIGVSHSIEPIEAVAFIKESQDMSIYFNRKTRVQKTLNHLNEYHERLNKSKKLFKNSTEKIQNLLLQTIKKGFEDFEDLENNLLQLKNKVQMAQFSANLDLSDHIFRLCDEEDFSKFCISLEKLHLFTISTNFQTIEKIIPYIYSIQDFIPFYNEKKNQIIEYYEKNKETMPNNLQKLFSKVIEGDMINEERVSILEHYENVARDLSMILEYFPRLKSLDIAECHIKTEGVRLIACRLRYSNEVIDLSLGGNDILDEGCEQICNIIPFMPNLENLFLYKNSLTSLSALKISQILPCTSNLKLISLNQNAIGDEGLEYICGVIPSVPNLEAIGLQKNQITEKSSKNIAKLILELPKLCDFSLDDNAIRNETANELIKIFPLINRNLKLYVRNNEINEELENKLKLAGGEKIQVAISYRIY